MRAKPSSNTRSGKSNRANGKSNGGTPRGIVKKSKETQKKIVPDLSVLRQPVDTSIYGLKQAVKVFETGTPEVLHLLTYDCDVVYECKVCRNLFRSIANFISHKRVYCTLRYSRSQDLQRTNKEGEDCTVILGDKAPEKLPTRITARKDLTSIVESLSKQNDSVSGFQEAGERVSPTNGENKTTLVHLEPMENTAFGVFQTVLNSNDSNNLMRNQVTELQNLLSKNEVILGPDGRVLENGLADLRKQADEPDAKDESDLTCSQCNIKFANRRTLAKHKKVVHECIRTSYSCPCCKNYFCNLWSVYRHMYKVHRKTNEQVRRLRSQIHKKDVKVDTSPVSNVSTNKKLPSPSRKKMETEQRQRLQQDNKEWMDHLEDDSEFQQCGGCGKRFERKAALTSHSQICQKRIAACNIKLDQNQPVPVSNSPMPVSTLCKKPVPKLSPEKKIGIQVRMNYCKNSSPSGTQVSRQSEPRSVLGDESGIETASDDGKYPFFSQVPFNNSLRIKDSSVLEHFLKNAASKCKNVEEVSSYLNKSTHQLDNCHTYEISTCKRSTVMRRSNVNKSRTLEAKCLQLRSALENGIRDSLGKEVKRNDLENTAYFDNNIDNTSESNTSAVSSLSSHLTPIADKRFVCEVEQSIEIKNINISRKLENTPSTEADSTSNNGGSLHLTYNSHTYKENIKFSPNGDATCEEVSTSVSSDRIPPIGSNHLQIDSSCLNDDEISINLKPLSYSPHESKSPVQETDFGNTISILTRNQLKAICKDDLVPKTETKIDKKLTQNKENYKKRKSDADVELTSREMIKKKLSKYIDQAKNICTICRKKFRNINGVERHLIIHTAWKRYQCLFNGCKFETFFKKTCLHHVTLHTKQSKEYTSNSLVGLINPNKWDLRIIDKPTNIQLHKSSTKDSSLSTGRDTESKKTIKPVNNQVNKLIKSPEKTTVKVNKNIDVKDDKVVKLNSNKGETKQALLTDFKNFKELSIVNGVIPSSPKIKTEKQEADSPKRKVKARKSKTSPIENGLGSEQNIGSRRGKTGNLKRMNSVEQISKKQTVINNELKEESVFTNNGDYENNENCTVKGRNSRNSLKTNDKSLLIDSEKEDCDEPTVVEHVNSHFPSSSQDYLGSINIHTPHILDGVSSLEEEESQESDKSVDETHLKKIFMEVIFGPQSKPAQSPSRPVRNKTRPKRDNDFILGSQKDSDVDGKPITGKKVVRLSSDTKSAADLSRKSK